MDTAIEKNDFEFRALQKTRLYPSGQHFAAAHDAICCSSKYQLAVAASGDNKLTSFSTSAIHALEITKQTANKEFTELQKKTVELAVHEKVVSVGTNCDETLLAVLVTAPGAGAFVHIFDMAAFSTSYSGEVNQLSSIRLGAEPTAQGVCIRWNPALPDTFAASSNDNSLLVAKVDIKNPAVFTIIAQKKMSATITQISWSPKGKQLTTGDSLGKICQLKMELDAVRGTMPPEAAPAGSPVCGLCWISTTEWLVAYAGPAADTSVFLLTIKKDQPVSWKPLPELQYGSAESQLSHQISFETSLLLHWNLVIFSSTKSSEISVIGKVGDKWQIWLLDDETRLDLPTDSTTKETFPLGLTVDLSSSTLVYRDEERETSHPACPILYVMTSDGVLTAHNAVSLDQSHKECTIEPTTIQLSSIRVGKKPAIVAVTPSTAPPQPVTTSQFFMQSPAKTTTQSSLFSTPTTVAPQTLSKPFTQLQPQASSTPHSQPPPAAASLLQATTMLPSPVQTSKAKEPVKETVTVEVETVNRLVAEALKYWNDLADDLRTMSVGIVHGADSVNAMSISVPDREYFRLYENWGRVITQLELKYQKLEDRIAEITAQAAAKNELVKLWTSSDPQVVAKFKQDSFDLDEKMRRLTLRLDDVQVKYAEGKQLFNACRQTKKRLLRPAPSLSDVDRDYIRSQLKTIQRWTSRLTGKMDQIDDELKQVRLAKLMSKNLEKGLLPAAQVYNVVNAMTSSRNEDLNVTEARNRMKERFGRMAANVPIRKVEPFPLANDEATSQTPVKPMDSFENMKDSLLAALNSSVRSTPRPMKTPQQGQRDATTQIDQPPQIKIVEKEIVVQPVVQQQTTMLSPKVPATPVKPQPSPGFVLPGTPVSISASAPPASTPGASTTPKLFEKAPATTTTPVVKTTIPAETVTPQSLEKKQPLTAKASIYPTEPSPAVVSTPEPKKTDSIFGGGQGLGEKTPEVKEEEVKKEAETPKKTEEEVEEKKQAPASTPQESSFSFGKAATTVATSTPPTATTTTAPAPAKQEPSFSFSPSSNQNTPVKPAEPTASFSFKPSSGFGQATPQQQEKSSIFGGGQTTAPSSGGFGAFSGAAKPTFSFKQNEGTPATIAAPASQPQPANTFSFTQKPASSSGFLAAAKATAEEGMMEDEMGAASNAQSGGGSGFGSFGSMSLGGGTTSAPSKNIFSSGLGAGQGQQNQQQAPQQQGFNIFSNAQKNNPNAFGNFQAAAANAAPKTSIFGGGGIQQTRGGGIFGGGFGGGQGAQQQQQQSSNSPFNTTAPKFGAAASFGGGAAKQNVFGGKPVFGGGTPAAASTPAAGGGFAKYASGGGNMFAATGQQQQNVFNWRQN